MPALNVLIVGDENSKSLAPVLKSKYLNKLYATFESHFGVCLNFNTFRELSQKCKALNIDIVLVEDEKMIAQGIADVLRKSYVNCLALTAYWTKLVLSNEFARKMKKKYGIASPEILKYPKAFPVTVKADGFTAIAGSVAEVIKIRQDIANYSPAIAQSIVLEKFIDGEKFELTSLFDGKNLVTFKPEGLKEDLVLKYNENLKKMFIKENAGFIGFINSEVIYSNGILYNTGFNTGFPEIIDTDLLYILLLAIYQKVNEIQPCLPLS